MLRNTILAVTLALVALAPLPADAGGQVSLRIEARNAEQAQAIRGALALYALRRDIRENGRVTQQGAGNAAALYQSGRGHRGFVEQRGDGHVGTLTQRGAGHAHGLFQSGRGTEAHVVQRGRGRAGLTILHGW